MHCVQGSHASWKVLDFFPLKFLDLESPGKSLWSWEVLEIEVKVLESPGKMSLKITIFIGSKNTKSTAAKSPDPTGKLTVLPRPSAGFPVHRHSICTSHTYTLNIL